VEISGKFGESFAFRSYRAFRYPAHDPCVAPFRDDAGKLVKADLILANQVWEHIDRPLAAPRDVYRGLRPDGWFWLAVPFFMPWRKGCSGASSCDFVFSSGGSTGEERRSRRRASFRHWRRAAGRITKRHARFSPHGPGSLDLGCRPWRGGTVRQDLDPL
jgi:SAM-dependent methyltransferase